VIYLDTHVIVWLYQKDEDRFTPETMALIDKEDLIISPMVELELEYLFEIDRINVKAEVILDYLKTRISLKTCENPFSNIVQKAKFMKWTRDPFDRIITAQAALQDSVLITKDKQIRKHYPMAIW